MELGFTILALSLAGGILFFAWKYVKLSFETRQQRVIRMFRQERVKEARRIKTLEADVAALNAKADKELGFTKPLNNLFTRSEERHLTQQKTIPTVLGVEDGPPS